jgi:hypothetical protein
VIALSSVAQAQAAKNWDRPKIEKIGKLVKSTLPKKVASKVIGNPTLGSSCQRLMRSEPLLFQI